MKNFTKSDLQNGMVVETREDRYMVVGDKIINYYDFMNLSSYEENLTLIEDKDDFDIIKVYDKVTSFNQMQDSKYFTLLWERKDEMETKEYIIEQEYIDKDFNEEDSTTIIKIHPNNSNGYHKSETNCPICLEFDEYYGFSLTLDSAKEVIKVLQEIVDYMEKK